MTNVLIYIVDALRADHLGCYGYHRDTSPNLDALAAHPMSVRFTRAFSPSTWTKPVAASLLSGCYPPAHGVRTRSDLFTRQVPRLPALLQEAGYFTGAISTIGNVSSSLGFAAGFDRFVDLYKDPILASRREVSNTGTWKLYFEEDTMVVLPRAEDVNERAIPWLEEAAARSQPWFLLLWVLDPHDPYYPPEGFRRWVDPAYSGAIDGSTGSVRRVRSEADRQHLLDLYDGEIAYTDQQFGHLIDGLRRRNMLDDTLIVVAGDHGEAFGEHGDFVHGHLAYDEVMRVPLLIKLPARLHSGHSRPLRGDGHDAGGKVSHALAQLVDVAPTILATLGLGDLATGMQGYSLLPALSGSPPRPVAYAETQSSAANQRLLAVRNQRWKYLRVDQPVPSSYSGQRDTGHDSRGWWSRLEGYRRQLSNREMLKKVLRNPAFYLRRQMGAREMLFDLEKDPAEQHNVLANHAEVMEEMQAALDAWLAECRVYASISGERPEGVGLDEATRRQLEGLGYL